MDPLPRPSSPRLDVLTPETKIDFDLDVRMINLRLVRIPLKALHSTDLRNLFVSPYELINSI